MSEREPVVVHVVTARVFAMDNTNEFEVNVIKKEARETSSSYLWEGRRLSKEKFLTVDKHQDGERLIGYRTYCLEADVEKAKELVIHQLKEQVKYRYDAIVKMQSLLQGEPTLNIKEVEREDD
jgi:hypothetical protein